MSDARTKRITRELFLAALGGNFRTIEPWVMDRLTGILEEEEFAADDCVFAQGDSPDQFYFVQSGRIELVRDGKSRDVVVGPRAFGLLDVLLERPRSHSAYAPMPLQLLKIRADAWVELLEDSFELARISVSGLTREVSALEERFWASGRKMAVPVPRMLEGVGAQLDIVERVVVLMNTPPLRGAGVQPLTDLATVAEEVAFAEGAQLFARGGGADRIFVVSDGRVEASREAPHVSWRGGSGQAVCGVVSFGPRITEWEARAATQTRALAFRLDDWFDVMEENFEMVRATLAALAGEHERLVREP